MPTMSPENAEVRILWHRLALVIVGFFALPFAVAMLVAFAYPTLTCGGFFTGVGFIVVAWFAGGGAATHVQARNFVVNARFTVTQNRYRLGTMIRGAGLMILIAAMGVGIMLGTLLGYQLSVTL